MGAQRYEKFLHYTNYSEKFCFFRRVMTRLCPTQVANSQSVCRELLSRAVFAIIFSHVSPTRQNHSFYPLAKGLIRGRFSGVVQGKLSGKDRGHFRAACSAMAAGISYTLYIGSGKYHGTGISCSQVITHQRLHIISSRAITWAGIFKVAPDTPDTPTPLHAKAQKKRGNRNGLPRSIYMSLRLAEECHQHTGCNG